MPESLRFTDNELHLISETRELIEHVKQLEEENAALRAVILSVNERLAQMVDLADTAFNELLKRLEMS